jgi:hypothetical protein
LGDRVGFGGGDAESPEGEGEFIASECQHDRMQCQMWAVLLSWKIGV